MANPEVAAADVTVPKTSDPQSPSENAGMGKSAFLEKVSDIPVVNAAKEYGTAAYNKVKLMNRLANLTLTKAESTVLYFALTAKPFLDKIEPQAKLVDNLAVRGLEVVESKAPYIMKTPEQMVEDARKLYASTLQAGYRKVDDVKNYGLQKVNDALVGTEQFIDNYLPPTEAEGTKRVAVGDQSLSGRATQLTTKVRERVYGHGVQQFIQMQNYSQDSIEKLRFTCQLLQHLKENYADRTVRECFDEAKVKATWIWDELNKEPVEENTESVDKSLEHRILSLARRITSTIVYTYSIVPLAGLPQTCLDGVQSASEYAIDLFAQFDQALTSGEMASAVLATTLSTIASLEGVVRNIVTHVPPKEESVEMEEMKPMGGSVPKESSAEESTSAKESSPADESTSPKSTETS